MAKKWIRMTSSFGGATGCMSAGSLQLLPIKSADNFIDKGHAVDLDGITGATTEVEKIHMATVEAKEKRVEKPRPKTATRRKKK